MKPRRGSIVRNRTIMFSPTRKVNKRSSLIDKSRVKPILEAFGKKALREITVFAVENFKKVRRNTPIVYGRKGDHPPTTKPRSVASVNRELCLLSKILTLAVVKKDAEGGTRTRTALASQ